MATIFAAGARWMSHAVPRRRPPGDSKLSEAHPDPSSEQETGGHVLGPPRVREVVLERDLVARFPGRTECLAAYDTGVDEFPGAARRLRFDCTRHEPRKPSHYPEDYLDPERIVLLCNGASRLV